ncbi:M20 family metallopeptidase [Metallosphaera javensis (ex Sakai et al. 2022)]|uniref:M20 family metallopeptidase n=1 Tax=Metallosphaera javensis (ex Sakai et al. 2022) TaxID=2775498 RepID=UPI0025847E4F|nr:MAG: succinyl-diaminopimelate desuccinylase [Metallosphaera javensis (ex Sakai et al. 2022)]
MNVESLLRDLVELETVNPPGTNYEDFGRLIREKFEELGFQVQLIEIPDEFMDRNYIYSPRHRGNRRVIVLARNDPEPKLHFNLHYDVVPPGDGWKTHPFQLKIVEDRAYGRGTSDMKGAMVSLYSALKIFNDLPIEIAFVPDEESGGIGTKYLVEKHGVRAKNVIFGEPSFPDIYIGHFGIIRGIVKVFGKQVHASKAKEGVNAFLEASRLALEIQRRYSSKEGRDNMDEPTVNLGGYVEGSTSDGIVPGTFAFSLYRSVSPNDKRGPEFDREVVEEAVGELGIKHEFEIKSFVPGSMTNPSSHMARAMETCIKTHLGWEPRKMVANIRYDAVFYGNADAVNFGPGEPDQAHVPNEYVNLRNVEKVSLVYECIMRSSPRVLL